jgi:CubicO group peptidase (beta-lactamase class C family)
MTDQAGPGRAVQEVLDAAVRDGQTPGAVFLTGSPGLATEAAVAGQAQVHGGPARPMHRGTLFDLASLTKVAATLPAVLLLAERGDLALDDQVRRFLPGFTGERRDEITVRQLLAHTSGLPAEIKFWQLYTDPAEASRVMLGTRLEHPPGSTVVYSDIGFMLLGRVVHAVAGAPLDDVVARLVTGPLGMTRTGFRPDASAGAEQAAATGLQPDGSTFLAGKTIPAGTALCGIVHDENARFFGGVAGHAGLFAPAGDLARYLELGWLGDSLLSPATRAEACRLQTAGTGGRRGLGWVLRGDAQDALGTRWPPTSATHTGFTGTSLAFDPASGYWAVLLTNDVHFGRGRGVIRGLREAAHDRCAPPGGRTPGERCGRRLFAGGAPPADRRVGALQRVHRLFEVALRDQREDAVDDRELGDPAGHGAGAERRLPGRRGQHQVGGPGQRRTRVVGEADRQRAVGLGHPHRVDRIQRGPGVGDADHDVLGAEHGRRGERHVRVRPGVHDLPDPVQLLLQVDGDQAARADAVDVDPPGADQCVHHLDQHVQVDLADGFLDRAGVGVPHFAHHGADVVVRCDVSRYRAPGARGPVAGRGGQRDAQRRVAVQADGPAEPDDRGPGGLRALRILRDRPARRPAGIADRQPGHPLLRGSQARHEGADPHHNVDRCLRLRC